MSVVQRCPNCGTTKATPGECEACHEAQVRYFCTNHEPGVWLDASTCPKCGARFGNPAREATPAAAAMPVGSREAAAAIRTRARSPAPARAPASPSAPPPAYSRKVPSESSGGRRGWAPVDEKALEPRIAPIWLWQQILQAAARARSMRTRADYRERLPLAREASGCVKRLLLGMLLLFLALGAAVFVFGRALLGY